MINTHMWETVTGPQKACLQTKLKKVDGTVNKTELPSTMHGE